MERTAASEAWEVSFEESGRAAVGKPEGGKGGGGSATKGKVEREEARLDVGGGLFCW